MILVKENDRISQSDEKDFESTRHFILDRVIKRVNKEQDDIRNNIHVDVEWRNHVDSPS